MGFPDQPEGQGQPEPPDGSGPGGYGSNARVKVVTGPVAQVKVAMDRARARLAVTQVPGYQQMPGYQAPGGYQDPVGYQQGGAVPGRTNGMAIAALVCGIAQFLLWFFILVPGFIAAVAALIFGVVGLGQIKRRGEGGKGMAIAGIVLGVLGVLGGIAWIILFLVGTRHFNYHMGNY